MKLTKELLQERLTDVEARFNAAKTRKEQAEASVEDADKECLRLQGEYRAVQALIDKLVEDEPKVSVKEEGVKSGK